MDIWIGFVCYNDETIKCAPENHERTLLLMYKWIIISKLSAIP